MTVRHPLVAGVLTTAIGALALIGWSFDVPEATSVVPGWRVMVPATAATFVLAGVALALAATSDRRPTIVMTARICAVIATIIPLLTFSEYFTGARTGVENWFGTQFDTSSIVAGRMSPLASLCFLGLAPAIVALTFKGARASAFPRIAAGTTLLTSWLAILALALDGDRLADVPRFPGMSVITVGLMAVASYGALMLSFNREGVRIRLTAVSSIAAAAIVGIAFAIPVAIGWIRDAAQTQLPQQLTTALLVFALTAAIATIIWQYNSRLLAVQRDRERALAELEQRVAERTSELATRNEALRESEDLLLDADRRKDEFLATLAHELRNPLAPIRNAVAVLRTEGARREDRDDARAMIDRQVTQMARLIDDLLDVSRITSGKLALHTRPLPLADVVNLAVATARPHIDQARHHLTVSLPRERVVVDADEARLSQMFANLLHNACKYTEPGGEIQLTVALPNDREVSVAIRDNGIGIPPEFLPRLFEKFSQVDAALERSQGGLGLGLSLVQGIAFLHGGRVEARSAGIGRGSEFIVHLPVMQVSIVPGVAAPQDLHARDSVSRRVLVVDDNVDSAHSLALLLRLQGHIVETAHDGVEAVELAARFQPEAVLLDLGLPALNGFEVCRRIRSMPWAASVVIIAQTGWGQAQDRARTLEAGFDAHLTKPIDPDTVQEMLIAHKGTAPRTA